MKNTMNSFFSDLPVEDTMIVSGGTSIVKIDIPKPQIPIQIKNPPLCGYSQVNGFRYRLR